MDHNAARTIVHAVWGALVPFAGRIATALADGRLAPAEGVQLGMEALQLSSRLIALLKDLSHDELQDVGATLERASVTVPAEGPA